MKVVNKLLAPVLVVGLLLTSLVTLHHLKDAKKDNVFRIGISQYITHKSLDATRKGFIDELKKEGYVDGKNIQIDFRLQHHQLKVWLIRRKQHRLSSQL